MFAPFHIKFLTFKARFKENSDVVRVSLKLTLIHYSMMHLHTFPIFPSSMKNNLFRMSHNHNNH